jgi:hypothetical protein
MAANMFGEGAGPSKPCLAWPAIWPCVAAFTVPICTVSGRFSIRTVAH